MSLTLNRITFLRRRTISVLYKMPGGVRLLIAGRADGRDKVPQRQWLCGVHASVQSNLRSYPVLPQRLIGWEGHQRSRSSSVSLLRTLPNSEQYLQ
jgi:hypothetical protein